MLPKVEAIHFSLVVMLMLLTGLPKWKLKAYYQLPFVGYPRQAKKGFNPPSSLLFKCFLNPNEHPRNLLVVLDSDSKIRSLDPLI